MAMRVCPWWLGYFLAGRWRRHIQDPAKILEPYVREGMTVVEPGPGMGFFTLDLARRVGGSGRVIAVDIQPKMLSRLKRRAEKEGLLGRLDARLSRPESMDLSDLAGQVDLVFAFAVVHEMPDAEAFLHEAAHCLKPGGALLLAEPRGHVKAEPFEKLLAAAVGAGFVLVDRPVIPRSRTALLKKAA